MDEKKTRWSLLDFDFLADVVEIMREGAERPGREVDQWKALPKTKEQESLYFDACLRHLTAARKATDKAQARSHLAAVAANAMIMHHLADWRRNEDNINFDYYGFLGAASTFSSIEIDGVEYRRDHSTFDGERPEHESSAEERRVQVKSGDGN